MITRQVLVGAALLTSALALTACGPDDSGSPAPATATATATGAANSPSPSADPTATRTGMAKPGTVPSHSGSPATDCTANAQHPGHKVINATAASGVQLTATATKFTCGPDVPNDGYYEPSGPVGSYTLASGATAEIIFMGQGPNLQHSVPITQLTAHINDCANHREVARPAGCYGGNYDITVDSTGHITHISELYHP